MRCPMRMALMTVCLSTLLIIIWREMPMFIYIYIYIYMIFKDILLIMFLNEPKLILFHTDKWFQVLLSITNNLIKHQSVFTQLNDQTILFLTTQFSMSHLFAHSLNVKQFYLTHTSDPIRCYQSEPWGSGNEGVFCIPQTSSIIEVLPFDYLVSYLGHSSGSVLPLAYWLILVGKVTTPNPLEWVE